MRVMTLGEDQTVAAVAPVMTSNGDAAAEA
jgi:hypothetical protein